MPQVKLISSGYFFKDGRKVVVEEGRGVNPSTKITI